MRPNENLFSAAGPISRAESTDNDIKASVLASAIAGVLPFAKLESLESRALFSGDGLTGEYFHNLDFSNRADSRVDESVDFNWRSQRPTENVENIGYSVRWTGQVKADETGTYQFHVQSDDGMRLWVDGELLIDDWNLHSVVENTGRIQLEAGKKYDIRLDYFQATGTATARLLWTTPSNVKEVIPTEALFSNSNTSEEPAPGDSSVITGFKLVDAKADEILGTLENGDVINLAELSSSQLNIVADAEGAASVKFSLNGKVKRIESVEPFATFGDNAKLGFRDWIAEPGTYTLLAEAFTGDEAKGDKSDFKSITFTIVDIGNGPSNPNPDPDPDPNPDPDPEPDPDPDPTPTPDPDPEPEPEPEPDPGPAPSGPNVVVLKAGTYSDWDWDLQSGKTYDGQGKVIIDFKGASKAFVFNKSNVTFRGIIFRNGGTGPQGVNAMVRPSTAGLKNVVFENCIFEGAIGTGVSLRDTIDSSIIGGEARWNGQLGLGAARSINTLIKNVKVHHNNYGLDSDPGWGLGTDDKPRAVQIGGKWYAKEGFESGGAKFTGTVGLVLENNEWYANHGKGCWLDIKNDNYRIINNRFYDNVRVGNVSWGGVGLNLELAAGGGVVEGGSAWGNEGPGISIEETRNLTVKNFHFNGDPLAFRDIANRSYSSVQNITVTGNTFRNTGIETSVGKWDLSTPSVKNIKMSNNDWIGTFEVQWGSVTYRSLQAVQDVLGFA